MARNRKSDEAGRTQEEADRNRQATKNALQQLDWVIGYLHGIWKLGLARARARNRIAIRSLIQQSTPRRSQRVNPQP